MTPADLAALIHAVATDVLTGRGLGSGELSARPGIASAGVTGPGFLNLRLAEGPTAEGHTAEVALGRPGPVYEVPANRVVRLMGGGSRTAAELVELVGRDTARFVLLRARPGATPVLDATALATATDRNPAFRVRHAHARLCALERGGVALGVRPDTQRLAGRLSHPWELEVLGLVGDYGRVTAGTEPYRLARHLEALVEAFERFEVCCRVLPLGGEPPSGSHQVRLALVAAARGVLADGLRRLGVSAPERL